MAHYLVIAHGVTQPEELATCLTGLLASDTQAACSLLVTATHPLRALKGQTRELELLARGRAGVARTCLEATGIYPARVVIGDGSPLVAAEDELRQRPDVYDAVVVCTERPGLTAWLRGDLRTQLEQRTRLPAFHIFAGAEDPWRRIPKPRMPRLARWWELTRLAPPADDGRPAMSRHRQLLPMAVLIVAYLVGGLTLALTVNRGFLLNDVVALIVYTFVLGGLFVVSRFES